MHSVREWIAKSARDFCSYRTLKKRVPIVGWLPKYKFDLLLQDIIAGIFFVQIYDYFRIIIE